MNPTNGMILARQSLFNHLEESVLLTTIIKKEILENILSYRFPLFLVICTLLIVSSVYINYVDYVKRTSDCDEQLRLTSNAIAASRMWDVVSGSVPMKGFHPPSPLSVFAHGFEGSLPQYYEFQSDGYKPGETAGSDESILSIFGRFDFMFTIQMIISLIVLLFASDVVSGEKELGTLRGTLSNSIPRHTVLLGKLLGGFIAAWIPLFTAFLLGIIILSVSSFPLFDSSIVTKVFIVFAAASFFIFVYFMMGLMISSSTTRSRTSLVAVLLVWIFFEQIVPKLSDTVASIVYPIRTETVISMQKSLITKTLDEEKGKLLGKQYEAIFGAGTRISTESGTPDQREQWDAFRKSTEDQFHARRARELAEMEGVYQKEKRGQQNIANTLALVSPSASFSRFLTDVCGTGEVEKSKYLEAIQAHQQTLQRELYSHVSRTTMILPSGGTASTASIGQMVDLKTLPAFSISKPTIGEIFLANTGSLISLAFWLVAPFAVAYVRFLKYDIR